MTLIHETSGTRLRGLRIDRGLIWLAAAAVILFALSPAVRPLSNNDIWIHLTTGRLILEEGSVPTTDRYTFTTPGTRYVAHEWLAAALYALAERLGGEPGVVIVAKVIPVLGIAIALFLSIRVTRAPLGLALPGVMIAFVVAHERIVARPELFAISLMLVALWLLLRDRRAAHAGHRSWAVAWLVPISMVWANVHASYGLGVILVVIFAAVELAERWLQPRDARARRVRMLGAAGGLAFAWFVATLEPSDFGIPAAGAIAFVALLLAADGPWRIFRDTRGQGEQGTLRLLAVAGSMVIAAAANPIGTEIYLFPFEFSTGKNLITSAINEWRPLLAADQLSNSLRLPAWWLYCSVWLGVLAVGAWRQKLGWLEVALFLAFALMPLHHVRWLGLAALVLTPALASALAAARAPSATPKTEHRLLAAALAVVCLGTLVAAVSAVVASAPDPWFRLALGGVALAAAVAGIATLCPRLSPRWPALAAGASAVLLILIAATPGYPRSAGERLPPWVGAGSRSFGPSLQAKPATDYLQSLAISGRLFTRYEWASYVIYANWPSITVFLDSRSEIHGEALLRKYLRMMKEPRAAKSGLDRYSVDLVLVPSRGSRGVLEAVRRDSQWELLYFDDSSVLLARNIPSRSLPPPLSKSLLDLTPTRQPMDAVQLEKELRQALSRAPQSAFLHFSLGSALRRQGRAVAALEQYSLVWDLNRKLARAAQSAGAICDLLDRPEEARLWYERAESVTQ